MVTKTSLQLSKQILLWHGDVNSSRKQLCDFSYHIVFYLKTETSFLYHMCCYMLSFVISCRALSAQFVCYQLHLLHIYLVENSLCFDSIRMLEGWDDAAGSFWNCWKSMGNWQAKYMIETTEVVRGKLTVWTLLILFEHHWLERINNFSSNCRKEFVQPFGLRWAANSQFDCFGMVVEKSSKFRIFIYGNHLIWVMTLQALQVFLRLSHSCITITTFAFLTFSPFLLHALTHIAYR